MNELETKAFPATSTEFFEGGDYILPALWNDFMTDDGGVGCEAQSGYETRTEYLPIDKLVTKGCNVASMAAIALTPMRNNTEMTVQSIRFLKAKIADPVEQISVSASKNEIANGKTATCTAEVLPTYATRTRVRWTSSNPELATVNGLGVVQAGAGKTGTVKIRATALDGSGKYDEVEITVVENTTVTQDKVFDLSDSNIKMGTSGSEKTSKGIEFAVDSTMNYIDFSKYLTANNIELLDYKGIELSYRVVDAYGEIVDNPSPGYGKVVFVESSKLNGYSNGTIMSWMEEVMCTPCQGHLVFYLDT